MQVPLSELLEGLRGDRFALGGGQGVALLIENMSDEQALVEIDADIAYHDRYL